MSSKSVVRWSGALFAVIFIFGLKTAILISDGRIFGRLALPPLYDDISYFLDGLARLAAFRSGGLRAVFLGLVDAPPHSPYASLAAMVGFLVSGSAQTAPYAMNAVALFALTIVWLILFRADVLVSILLSFIVISTTWFDHAVTIYHPDLIAGYGAAIVTSLILFQYRIITSTPRVMFIGAFAGLVLMIKPTAFPAVLSLWSVALVFGVWASRSRGNSVLASSRIMLVSLVVLLLVAGPYFFIHMRDLLSYIHDAFVVDAQAWRKLYVATYGTPDYYRFYLEQVVILFGAWLWVGPILLLFAIAMAARKNRSELIALIGLLVCIVTSYAIPTFAPVKLMLFGLLFYGMLIIVLFIVVDSLLTEASVAFAGHTSKLPTGAMLRGGVILVVAVTAMLEAKDGQLRFPAPLLRIAPVQYRQIYAALADLARRAVSKPDNTGGLAVFFPTPLPLPPSDYQFRGLQDGINITVQIAPLETDVDRLMPVARQVDVVAVPDAKSLAIATPYPVNAVIPEFERRLHGEGFLEQSPIELPDGGAVLLFRHPTSDRPPN